MFELKLSGDGLFLAASIVAVILFAGVYLFRVWATKREQRRTMERISGESWGSLGEWSSQTCSEIEDSYEMGLPTPKECPPMPKVSQPRAELDDDDPTLDMNLRLFMLLEELMEILGADLVVQDRGDENGFYALLQEPHGQSILKNRNNANALGVIYLVNDSLRFVIGNNVLITV